MWSTTSFRSEPEPSPRFGVCTKNKKKVSQSRKICKIKGGFWVPTHYSYIAWSTIIGKLEWALHTYLCIRVGYIIMYWTKLGHVYSYSDSGSTTSSIVEDNRPIYTKQWYIIIYYHVTLNSWSDDEMTMRHKTQDTY